MQYDTDKVDDTVLALLTLTVHQEDEFGARAWKGHDWDALNRLHEKELVAILFPRRNQWSSRPKVWPEVERYSNSYLQKLPDALR